MKCSTKRIAAFLVDAKSMMLGVAIFTFVWVWLCSPQFQFDRYMFIAMLLLTSSILIQVNTLGSNLVAAILSGYLPVEILREFWVFPSLAEVPILSSQHFRLFFGNIRPQTGAVMFIAVTLMMLARSVFAVIRNDQSETATADRAR